MARSKSLIKDNKGKLLVGAAAVAAAVVGWLSIGEVQTIVECVMAG